jgi:hypothetical protein
VKGLLKLSLVLSLVVTLRAADPVEHFSAHFAHGSKVLVFRGLPHPNFESEARERAEQSEYTVRFGEAFYPDAKELSSEYAEAWLARACDKKSYYSSQRSEIALDGGFHADIAFWVISADQKDEAYCLFSFGTQQVRVFAGGGGATLAATLELEKMSRDLLRRYFKAEIKDEANHTAEPASPSRGGSS